jgi:hypothetical protein
MNSSKERGNSLVAGGRNLQGKKLACKESDWRLPGTTTPVTTRTRGNGAGRPQLETRKKLFIEPSTSSSDSSWEDEEDDMDDAEDEFDEEFDGQVLLAGDDLDTERA